MVTPKIEIEPADRDGEGGVCTHSHEEERAILEMVIRMRRKQNSKTRNRHRDRKQSKQKTMFSQIREIRNDQCEHEGSRPWRHGMQLRADLRVAVGFYDAGGEEGVAVGGDDEAKVHEAAEEKFVVFEAVEDVAGGDLAGAGGASLVF